MKNKMSHILHAYRFFTTFSKKLRKDAVSAYAGQLAFFILLSFFPFVMFLLTLLKHTSLTQGAIFDAISHAVPAAFSPYIISWVSDIYSRSSSTLLSITAITALWLASKGFLAMIYAFDTIYDRTETRNFIILRLYAILYTFAFAVILLFTLALLVFGNHIYAQIYPKLPVIGELILSIISVRAAVSICILILFFSLLYKMIPNRRTSFVNELPGAILATAGWMIFSFLYSYYIDNISNYSTIYGTMTTIAFLMLWLYICMYILFLGAELNVLIKKLSRFPYKNTKASACNQSPHLP